MKKTNQRKEYLNNKLEEKNIKSSPIEQFDLWFNEATKSNIIEPNAMNLATVNLDGTPSSRMVLLRGYSKEGFIFYTSYESQKGLEIATNPKVAICFYWDTLERQVRISANIKKLPRKDSATYFEKRPKDAQISAYISKQSKGIKDREELEALHKKANNDFRDKQVPLPDNWGGYIAKPISFEFWQGRKGRLHDRIKYSLNQKNNWTTERLCP